MNAVLEAPTVAIVKVDPVERSKSLVVTSNEQYVQACEEKLALDVMIADRKALHDPVVSKAFETHRAATAARRSDVEPLEIAKAVYERVINTWRRDQERAAQQRALEEQQARELMALQEREAEIVEAEAMQAAPEEIAAIIERRVYVPPPVVSRAPVPHVAGIRKKAANWKVAWDGKPNAKMRLIQFVAKNPQFEHLLALDETSANNLARGMKTLMAIPGIVAFDADS